MPIYEYQCAICNHRFDVMQSFKEAALSECPTCGKPSLTKLISAPAFHLKGSGWYATDFKKAPQPQAEQRLTDEVASKENKTEVKETTEKASNKMEAVKSTAADKTEKN